MEAEGEVMKCFYTDKPSGTFFAIYSDLSAAYLFKETESGKFLEICRDENAVDAHWFQDAGYLWFFNIDDTFAKHAFTIKDI